MNFATNLQLFCRHFTVALRQLVHQGDGSTGETADCPYMDVRHQGNIYSKSYKEYEELPVMPLNLSGCKVSHAAEQQGPLYVGLHNLKSVPIKTGSYII